MNVDSAFWDDAERLLCAEDAKDGIDRESFAALRQYLTATGMGPDGTTLRITAGGVSTKTLDWCQLAVTSRQELIDAGWEPPKKGGAGAGVERLPPDSIESWIVVPKLMAEEETGVGLEGDFSTAKARAERVRRVLKVLCARRLEMYPSPTQLSSLSARPSVSRPLNSFFSSLNNG